MTRALFLASDASYRLKEERIWVEKASFYLEFVGSRGVRSDFMVSPHYPASNRLRSKGLTRLRLRFHVSVALRMIRPTVIDFALRRKSRGDVLATLRKLWLACRVDWFQDFFRKSNVDILLGIGLSEPELTAARNLGISSVEFQHGRVTQHALDREFYSSVRPDYYVCWFESDSQLIEDNGMIAVPLGPPWAIAPNSSPTDRGSSDKVLLVILQYGFHSDFDDAGACHEDLLRCLRVLKQQQPSILFRFRAHPVQPMSKQRRVFLRLAMEFPESSFHYSNEGTVFDSLNGATACITYSSSTWIECLAANVPWYLIEEWSRADASQHLPVASSGLSMSSLEELQNLFQIPRVRHGGFDGFCANIEELEMFSQLLLDGGKGTRNAPLAGE